MKRVIALVAAVVGLLVSGCASATRHELVFPRGTQVFIEGCDVQELRESSIALAKATKPSAILLGVESMRYASREPAARAAIPLEVRWRSAVYECR